MLSRKCLGVSGGYHDSRQSFFPLLHPNTFRGWLNGICRVSGLCLEGGWECVVGLWVTVSV